MERGVPKFDRDKPDVCDFCTQTPVVWTFPTRDRFDTGRLLALGHPTHPVMDITMTSFGWWAACEQCKRLVQADDRHALASRSANNMKTGPGSRLPFALKVHAVKSAHSAFFENRIESEGFVHEPLRVPYVDPVAKKVYCRDHVPHQKVITMHSLPSACCMCSRTLGYDL